MSSLSILDIARGKGVTEDERGMISADEFLKHDLPFFSGCQVCSASLGPYNAYPSKSGFIRCGEYIGTDGFDSVEAFDAFEAAR